MAERIGIVVDSSADFPAGMIQALGVHVIPIHIVIDGQDYLHGVSIDNDRVIAAMRADRDINILPPIPSEYVDRMEKLLRHYDRLISFHASRELSNSYISVQRALQLMFDDAAERITTVDTRTCTIGKALIVKRAVEMLRRHQTVDALLHDLAYFLSNGRLYLAVDDHSGLKRGGRLNFFSSMVGGMLDIKPVLELTKGRLVPLSKHRGLDAALASLARYAHEDYRRHHGACEVWIAHAADKEKRDRLLTEMELEMPAALDNLQRAEIGPSVAAQAGPGCLALGLMPV
ncbi:MAG: DegV family protein [Desulfobacterales bacterium]|jgi:DegV family protein with EDD domain